MFALQRLSSNPFEEKIWNLSEKHPSRCVEQVARNQKRFAGKVVGSGVSAGNRLHPADKDVVRMGGIRNRVLTPWVPAPNGSDRYSICVAFVVYRMWFVWGRCDSQECIAQLLTGYRFPSLTCIWYRNPQCKNTVSDTSHTYRIFYPLDVIGFR